MTKENNPVALDELVNYEGAFDLELVHPSTDAPLGIVFRIVSIGARAAEAVNLKHLNRVMAAKKSDKNAEAMVKLTKERLAACVVSWDWGGREFRAGEGVPEFTPANVIEVLSVNWIFEQVDKAASDIANFTIG